MIVQSGTVPKREDKIAFSVLQKWMFLFFPEYSSLGRSCLFIEGQEFYHKCWNNWENVVWFLLGPLKDLFLLCGLNTFSGAFFDRCVVMNIYSIAKHEK